MTISRFVKSTLAVALLCGAGLASVAIAQDDTVDPAITAQIEGGPLTIWDGVFTAEQAEAGKGLYTQSCQTCHGPTGRGGPGTPPVTGSALNTKWADIPLLDYYLFAHGNMPPGAGGSVGSTQDYVNIVAYILSMHGAEPGEVMLTDNEDQLLNITIIRKPAE